MIGSAQSVILGSERSHLVSGVVHKLKLVPVGFDEQRDSSLTYKRQATLVTIFFLGESLYLIDSLEI